MKKPQEILIIRPGALGDTLMLMPSIALMKSSYRISLAGRSPGIDFLRPYVQNCFNYEGPGWHTLFTDAPEKTRLPSFDPLDGAVAFLSDTTGKVWKNLRALLPDRPVHLFSPFPPKGSSNHAALYLARCLRRAGIFIDPTHALDNASKNTLMGESSERIGKGRILLHPGSGSTGKNHPPEFWIDLMGHLRKVPGHTGYRVLLGRAEEGLRDTFESLSEDDIAVTHLPGNADLLSFLGKTPLYIGHDNGVTHLAAMCGTPVIALFKNSSPAQWRPLGPRVTVIESRTVGPDLAAKVCEKALELLVHSQVPRERDSQLRISNAIDFVRE